MAKKEKLKICFITPAYYPAVRWGGPVISVRLLAEELVRQGHSVSVLTTAFGLEQNRTVRHELGGVAVAYFRFFTFKRWFISWNLLQEVWARRKEFDLFHLHLVWDPVCWMSGVLLALAGARIIVSPRGTVEAQLIRRRSWLLKTIIYRLFVRSVFRRSQAFHFTSQAEQRAFFTYTRLREKGSVVVPNLFDAREFARQVSTQSLAELDLKQGKYILYSGRLNWKKQLELLLEAFKDFSSSQPDLKLALVGAADKDYLVLLKERIASLGLGQKVVLDPRVVAGEFKLALFQHAFAFVLPSYSENFGFVALEALASRVPLIVSSGVGLRELLEKYQAALVFQSKEELTARLVEVSGTERRANLVKNGLALLEKEFKSAELVKRMEKLYFAALE